ncbi:maleylpyruvate isomerase N-terminal domain-containing protein [Streptomyces shenzhenensis]|uniref:maleylpyruvate isomerase N-terminal domain-containing protein n=1 Tax=Streptomyces shenzhenensis TaxID=943815 RepID=UPI003D8AD8D0
MSPVRRTPHRPALRQTNLHFVAFRLEAGELSWAVAGLPEAEWDRPTRCEPWSVREVLGQVRVVIAWLPGMLAAPPPDKAEVSAVEYYWPDDRFAPQTNTARIASARDDAVSQFQVTRVVEAAVHGLDLVRREPWLTPQAADVVLELLLGPDRLTALLELGWDQARFLRKATGREPLDAAETTQTERLGIRRMPTRGVRCPPWHRATTVPPR